MTGVATQVASPEVIAPDVAQGCRWSQILMKHTIIFDANLTRCARSTLLLAHRHAGVQQRLQSCMVLDGQREIPCC